MPPTPTPAVPDEEAPDAAPVPPATDHPPDAAADAAANAALEAEMDADQAAERRRHWEASEDDAAWANAHPAPDLALGLREGVKDFLKGLWG